MPITDTSKINPVLASSLLMGTINTKEWIVLELLQAKICTILEILKVKGNLCLYSNVLGIK